MLALRVMRLLPHVGAAAALLLGFSSCGDSGEEPWSPSDALPRLHLEWSLSLAMASEGSPALCDLGGDGRFEVLAPVSSSFAEVEETGVWVVDAVNGEPRLFTGEGSHPYGSPACALGEEGRARDVLLGGRFGDIVSIDASDGSARYLLSELHPSVLPAQAALYSFASTAALSQDERLAATAWVDESEPLPRGRLIVFRPASGELLAVFEAPDGEPAYASPSIHRVSDTSDVIIFPTGGELVGGHLYLLEWDGEQLTLRASVDSDCETGGFVASAHLADLDGDGEPEIIAGDYCGGVHVVDLDGERRFFKQMSGTITANPVSGDFDGDGRLDILAVAVDFNPSVVDGDLSNHSEIAAFRGRDGEELFRFSHEMPILASPAVLDLNGDASDDFILVSADFRSPEALQQVKSGIRLHDGRSGELLSQHLDYPSLSTPVIDDIDGDGVPDLFVMRASASEGGEARLSRFSILSTPPFDPARSFSGFRGHPGMGGSR